MLPRQCPACEVKSLRDDGTCSCGYGKRKTDTGPLPSIDRAEVERRYQQRVDELFAWPPCTSIDWADRILEREARGERLPLTVILLAKSVIAER